MHFRDLSTHADFKAVVLLEKEIWGYSDDEDLVPAPILAVSVKCGGILVAGFDDATNRMVAFVYSLPGVRHGKPLQWSHMLGVLEEYRRTGIGYQLKIEQRRRAVAAGYDLIEWTYDPLQAINAHLNFTKLGVLVSEYAEDMYGQSSSPLHRGVATDRFIAQWWICSSRVEQRIASGGTAAGKLDPGADSVRVNTTRLSGRYLECVSADCEMDEARLRVEIPLGFSEMLVKAPELARHWRAVTRRIFSSYFARGYHVIDFLFEYEQRRGWYLLTQ